MAIVKADLIEFAKEIFGHELDRDERTFLDALDDENYAALAHATSLNYASVQYLIDHPEDARALREEIAEEDGERTAKDAKNAEAGRDGG